MSGGHLGVKSLIDLHLTAQVRNDRLEVIGDRLWVRGWWDGSVL